MKKALLVAIFIAMPAAAHDVWLEPSLYRPRPGDKVSARLMVGERFRGEPAAMERFSIHDAAGDREVAGSFDASPGLTVITHRTRLRKHAPVSAAKFAAYLREEGLTHIRPRTDPVREVYSRCVKSLVGSGPGYDRVFGQRLEIIPESIGPSITLRVVFEERPLSGVLVTAMNGTASVNARTDANGRAMLPLSKPGKWLIKSVHMIPAPEESGIDFESIWSSLTFER